MVPLIFFKKGNEDYLPKGKGNTLILVFLITKTLTDVFYDKRTLTLRYNSKIQYLIDSIPIKLLISWGQEIQPSFKEKKFMLD